jgi:hypothetical protein
MDPIEQITFRTIRTADIYRRIDYVQQNLDVLEKKIDDWHRQQIELDKEGHLILKQRLHAARCYNEIHSVFDIKMKLLSGYANKFYKSPL